MIELVAPGNMERNKAAVSRTPAPPESRLSIGSILWGVVEIARDQLEHSILKNIPTAPIAGWKMRAASLGIMTAIFPGFYIYHAAAGLGFMPLFLGGWASAWNLVGTILLAPILLATSRSHWRVHIPFAVLIAIAAAYALYYSQYGNEWQSQPIMFVETGKLILGWACLYSLGWLLPVGDWSRRLTLMFFIATSAVALIWADWRLLSFVLEFRSTAPKGIAEYSGLATAYFMVTILALAMMRSRGTQIAIIAVATLVSFLLSSRSELVAFVIIVVGWAFIAVIDRYFRSAIIGLALTGSILSGLMFFPEIVKVVSPQGYERILQLRDVAKRERSADIQSTNEKLESLGQIGNFRNAELFDLQKSQSMSVRMITVQSSIDGIQSSPVLGDYGGQIRDLGQFGLYAHDVLSVWQQYGFAAFLLYLGLSIAAAIISLWHVLLLRSRDPRWISAAYVSGICLLLIVTTKAVYWPIPAFGWGLALSNFARNRKAVLIHTPPATGS
jgi:hypothetical protein